jgi:predicted metal-dependent enzyme (double-stranded beta helix superfamily)
MSASATQDSYTIRDLAEEVRRQMAIHGSDGPKLLEGLREPISKVLASDLSDIGVKREGNHIDESRYLYYDGEMSITFDHLPKDKDIPPHDHGIWETLAIYSGRLRHTVYDRTDDGTKEGYAKLAVIDDRVLETKDMAIVAPPAEIHSFTALTDDTWSVTVVGGRYKADRAYYKPETNSYVRRNPKRKKIV